MLRKHLTRAIAKETRTVLRFLRGHNIVEEMARGPYHFFWLLREDQYRYADWDLFVSRKDAPVIISDEILGKLWTGLRWVPTVFPYRSSECVEHGLFTHEETVINQVGAPAWSQVLRAYAQIFAAGPLLTTFPVYVYDLGEDGLPPRNKHFVQTERDDLLSDLTLLAEWGDKAATGEYFILHIGM